ncbi:MAG: DNA mismatch repair endonuclease MutL [Ruminococcaceae bacterium]|nr:DNA mismatch repair endonuclease MutL [Oscillospiraceae bacterium]
MAKIHVLDKHVAELIAAGEVVERPASVVKELMENSIDAGARHVTVEIRDGGVTYMRITDDGCGIPREDVPTAFLRHATSKVREEADLNGILTLGFRGEALASVAAVARVRLMTCAAGEMVGTRYEIHGGEEILLEDEGCAEGSTFEIEDLFYNIPARMKFLKKDVSEGNAVAGVVERLALSHPEIAVRFIRNGRTELQTPGDGDLFKCIHAVFGKAFASGLIPVDYCMGGVTVTGYICKPEACRQNRSMQHFFINGRYVKTQTAMVAMERAYKGVMMVGKFPTCVLCLQLPAETVDANVHPAKIEVRFINEKPVFDAVFYAVRSAIESGDRVHQIHLDEMHKSAPKPQPPTISPTKTSSAPPTVGTTAKPIVPVTPPVRVAAPSFLNLSVDDRPTQQVALADEPLFKGATPYRAVSQEKKPPVVACQTLAPEEPDQPEQQSVLPSEKPPIRVLGELFSTYILAQMGESLYIIDKHATHERILYNSLIQNERADEQMLLAPVSVTLSRDEHTAVIENLELLKKAGIALEDFGESTVLVRSFPLMLSGEDVEGTLREIASGLADGTHRVAPAKLEWIYHSSACRAATKAGDSSQPAELEELARRALWDDAVRYCPHGRPVCIEMTRRELEKEFGRIQ